MALGAFYHNVIVYLTRCNRRPHKIKYTILILCSVLNIFSNVKASQVVASVDHVLVERVSAPRRQLLG